MDIIQELQDKIIEFRDRRNWKQFHTPKNLAIAINIETSELLGQFRWKEEFIRDKTEEEVADIFIFLLIFCYETNIKLDDVVLNKLKTNDIKYPVDRFYNSNRKYDE